MSDAFVCLFLKISVVIDYGDNSTTPTEITTQAIVQSLCQITFKTVVFHVGCSYIHCRLSILYSGEIYFHLICMGISQYRADSRMGQPDVDRYTDWNLSYHFRTSCGVTT
jgi:hypothetical protein